MSQMNLSRRSFLMAGAAAVALAGFVLRSTPSFARIVDRGLPAKTLAGYAWPWTVRPGEHVEFKVSAYAPGEYRAELVRLICADAFTDGGSQFREEPVSAPFARSYPGRLQKTFPGSFVEIPLAGPVGENAAFTLTASVYPTKVVRGSSLVPPAANPNPRTSRAIQHMIGRWNDQTKTGWSLALDENDRPAFYVGDGSGAVDKIALSEALALRRWVRLTVSYDPAGGRVRLSQEPVYQNAGDARARRADEAEGHVRALPAAGPLRMGAAVGGPSNSAIAAPAGSFNGKLDTVRMMRGTLDPASVRRLWAAREPGEQPHAAIGWWDFVRGAGTTRVHDISGNGLDGTTVNLPERAVIGVNWDGRTFEWPSAPHQYGAIYFHEDALSDADWATDFEFVVPRRMRSGIYAVKLHQGASETYIPFYVAPSATARKARVALLLPTFTYLGYANALGVSYYTRRVMITEPSGATRVGEEEWMPIYSEEKSALDLLNANTPGFGLGIYRTYVDGAPVRQSPMRIPNLANEPKVLNRNVTADTDIIEWLEHDRVDYDVITDELLHREGVDLLNGYSAVMTGSHTEYLTWEMRDAYMEYLRRGGRLMSIGGNGFHMRVAVHREVPGVIECRKRTAGSAAGLDFQFEAFCEFDGRPTGRFREMGAPANMLHGLGTTSLHALTAGTHYRKKPAGDDPRARFIFEGVDGDIIGDFGKSGGGAASEELDFADLTDGTPIHSLIVATSENLVWPLVSEDGLTDPKYRLNFDPRADMVFFETPSGGAVFSVGSMGWRGALSHNGFNNNVAQITRNVLRRFVNPEPFQYPS